MAWTTVKTSETDIFIEDGEIDPGKRVLIGSIVKRPNDNRWHIEVMRFDSGLDFRADFAEYNEALAYIQGVEEAQARELRAFNFRWEADQRAIKRWQAAHPGNDDVWPDHADMVLWLMEERERLKEQLGRFVSQNIPALYDIAKKLCHENGMDWTDARTGELHKAPKP